MNTNLLNPVLSLPDPVCRIEARELFITSAEIFKIYCILPMIVDANTKQTIVGETLQIENNPHVAEDKKVVLEGAASNIKWNPPHPKDDAEYTLEVTGITEEGARSTMAVKLPAKVQKPVPTATLVASIPASAPAPAPASPPAVVPPPNANKPTLQELQDGVADSHSRLDDLAEEIGGMLDKLNEEGVQLPSNKRLQNLRWQLDDIGRTAQQMINDYPGEQGPRDVIIKRSKVIQELEKLIKKRKEKQSAPKPAKAPPKPEPADKPAPTKTKTDEDIDRAKVRLASLERNVEIDERSTEEGEIVVKKLLDKDNEELQICGRIIQLLMAAVHDDPTRLTVVENLFTQWEQVRDRLHKVVQARNELIEAQQAPKAPPAPITEEAKKLKELQEKLEALEKAAKKPETPDPNAPNPAGDPKDKNISWWTKKFGQPWGKIVKGVLISLLSGLLILLVVKNKDAIMRDFLNVKTPENVLPGDNVKTPQSEVPATRKKKKSVVTLPITPAGTNTVAATVQTKAVLEVLNRATNGAIAILAPISGNNVVIGNNNHVTNSINNYWGVNGKFLGTNLAELKPWPNDGSKPEIKDDLLDLACYAQVPVGTVIVIPVEFPPGADWAMRFPESAIVNDGLVNRPEFEFCVNLSKDEETVWVPLANSHNELVRRARYHNKSGSSQTLKFKITKE